MKTEQGTASMPKPHGSKNKATLARVFALALSMMLVFSGLIACSPSSNGGNGGNSGSNEAASEQSYTPGTYTGTGTGNGGDITVEVTFSEDAITDIKVVSQSETETVAAEALETIPASIIEYQSLGVDTMSGATMSSLGLVAAITDCVEQAGGNVSQLKKVPAQEKSKKKPTPSWSAAAVRAWQPPSACRSSARTSSWSRKPTASADRSP